MEKIQVIATEFSRHNSLKTQSISTPTSHPTTRSRDPEDLQLQEFGTCYEEKAVPIIPGFKLPISSGYT
ncbi:hypothetical protein FOLKNPGA_02310 [Legionella sp. PC1000]|nr:hypothetical protein FOLKNPGA_02310 [Legionella sp. PC1000]